MTNATIKPTMSKETDIFPIRMEPSFKKRLLDLAEARGVSGAALVMMALTQVYPELVAPKAIKVGDRLYDARTGDYIGPANEPGLRLPQAIADLEKKRDE